jgi:hypothetical protein
MFSVSKSDDSGKLQVETSLTEQLLDNESANTSESMYVKVPRKFKVLIYATNVSFLIF